MKKSTPAILGALVCLAPPAMGQTVTLNPGSGLQAAIEAAAPGTLIQLNPGNYTTFSTGPCGAGCANAFAITQQVRIVGLGSTPAAVRLIGGASGDYAVKYFRYNITVPASTPPIPSGGSLENLTIDTSPGGIQVLDFGQNTRLANITIKDVVINTKNPGTTNVYGILVKNSDNIVMDNMTVTSFGSGFYLIDNTGSLIMNSTLTNTVENFAAGVAIIGGSRNRVVNNTIGSVKTNPADNTDTSYPFRSDSVVIYNSSENRVEGNTIQGHRDGGVSVQAQSLSFLVAPQNTAKALNNYIGKNRIISTGFAGGRDDGGGIWTNCSSDGSWVYGNDSYGAAEAGVFVWLSSNNMVLGNSFHDNKKIGVTVSGGAETPPFCYDPAYRVKPRSNYVQSNYVFYNRNDQINVRNANTTEVSRNFISPRNGFGGPLQVCVDATFCQSAFALETDSSDTNSNGMRVVGNTSAENIRGLFNNDGKVTGLEFYFNRMITSTVRSSVSRFVTGTALNIDFGSALGGNFWDRHTAFGNPSATNSYSGIFHDTSNNTGNVVDRFPYQTEDFGRGQNVIVSEPRLNQTAARGTPKTVRWDAPGCTLVDLLLDGATGLVSNLSPTGMNVPNIGYAVITIPTAATIGAHTVQVRCKDAAGTSKGHGTSPSFNVTSSDVQLLAPGRDDVFDAGQQILVAWKKAATVTSVNIEFSSDGGATFPTMLMNGVTANFARVTLPSIPSAAYAMIRVVATSGSDATDGVFAVRGTTGAAFTNVSAGRKFILGQNERLEWASPQGSRLVDISATVGVTTRVVATNLPDRGGFDWIFPDLGAGTLSLAITFKTIGATTISTLPGTTAGTTLLPTTITFGATPSLAPTQTATISATTNSALTVTFSSLTPTICTVSGTTVTAGATAGTCSIAADQAGNSTYAAAPQTILSFTVGQSQTITFGAAPLVVVNGTGTVSATSTSGLTVAFTTLTPTICTVLGSTVSGVAAGTCMIAGNQPGNGTFGVAPQVIQTFSVLLATTIPRLVNISTRGIVATGDNIMIGGFVIGGNAPKQVVITGRGPILADFGVPSTLADPAIRLFEGATEKTFNDNWQTAPNVTALSATGLAPTKPTEAAILTTVQPNVPYTVHVTGINNTIGVALVEVFEADKPEIPILNISTRGNVLTGDNVLIGGFIIQGNAAQQVLINAKGPSLGLAPFNLSGALADTVLELYQAGVALPIATNDNWGESPDVAAIQATGNAPSGALESAIIRTLAPGAYTAIVRGKGSFQGLGLVEVYKR